MQLYNTAVNFLNHYILKKQDIEVGETYLFVGSDSPKRAHLAGQPFTVSSIEKVYRKVSYRHKKRSMKVTRFFNDDGVGARAEELEELPKTGFYQCQNQDCRKWSRVADLHVEPGNEEIHNVCPECGHTAIIFNTEKFEEATSGEEKDRGHGFCPKCDYPLTNWGAASDGDGDIYDEIGCDRCEEVVRKEHASYCTCPECDPWGLKSAEQDREALPVPLCIGCNKKASELEEYIEAAQEMRNHAGRVRAN